MKRENVIEIKNLSKNYFLFDKDYKIIPWLFTKKGHTGIKKALTGIELTVKKGEVIGLIGKNGAGKSTLMKLIAGITLPTSGEVKTKGKVGSLINLGAGFNPNYTGRENIYYKGNLLGMSNKEVEKILTEVIEFADIGEYFDLPLKMYSSGMKARLGFALAIFSNPDILIIDEVFAVGDRDFREKSAQKMNEMFNSGKSIIFSSHSDNQIKRFCNKVVYLEDGKVEFNGEVEEGLEFYKKSQNKK